MAIVRADRSIARAGSKVVKSVAGYDAHRFFCGTQGRLAAIGAVAFRTLPLRAIQPSGAELFSEARQVWIQRVKPADYPSVREMAEGLAAADAASQTLWHTAPPARVDHDWVLAPDGGLSPSPAPPALLRRAKDLLDPEGRFPSLILPGLNL
jgi:FAD/FMN-containing dehydrogenase